MSIQQEVIFNSSPSDLFSALTSSRQFSELTGTQALIEDKAGGKFTCFDGMITGVTIEFEPHELLVQAWRVSVWEKGVYSIITFKFERISDSETKLLFEHKGFPEDQKEHLEKGWYERYWEPMKQYLQT